MSGRISSRSADFAPFDGSPGITVSEQEIVAPQARDYCPGMDIAAWYEEYVEVFAACGRGELPVEACLDYYAVPLLVTTPAAVVTLPTREALADFVQSQVEGMLAAGYHHSVMTDGDELSISPTTTVLRRAFSRVREDGSEISALTATYVVIETGDGRRIASLLVHG